VKKFSFKLERVLKLKKMHESLRKRELGLELKSLNDKENSLEESRQIKTEFNEDFNSVQRVGILDPIKFRRYGSYMQVLSNAIVQKSQEAKEQIIKVDQARQDVKSAVDQTKIFEKLHEIEHRKYLMESDKEIEKELSEIAIARFRRQQHESGSALNVLMAIGASIFAAFLVLIGIMFLLGMITPAKARVIAKIIRYDSREYTSAKEVIDEANEDKKAQGQKGPYVLFGGDDPYVLDYDNYKYLKDTEKKYHALLKENEDQKFAITKDVLDQRREILRRMEEALKNTKADIEGSVNELKKGDQNLTGREKALEKAKKAFRDLTESKRAQKFQQAQADILKSFSSMDPEAIVRIITNEKDIEELKVPQRAKAVAYAAIYVSKLQTRKRAGVMEALTPAWAMAVNNYLEGDVPL
jgi:flagellar protein FliJ